MVFDSHFKKTFERVNVVTFKKALLFQELRSNSWETLTF